MCTIVLFFVGIIYIKFRYEYHRLKNHKILYLKEDLIDSYEEQETNPIKIFTKHIQTNNTKDKMGRTSSVFTNMMNETKTSKDDSKRGLKQSIGVIKEYCPSVFRHLRQLDDVTADVIS